MLRASSGPAPSKLKTSTLPNSCHLRVSHPNCQEWIRHRNSSKTYRSSNSSSCTSSRCNSNSNNYKHSSSSNNSSSNSRIQLPSNSSSRLLRSCRPSIIRCILIARFKSQGSIATKPISLLKRNQSILLKARSRPSFNNNNSNTTNNYKSNRGSKHKPRAIRQSSSSSSNCTNSNNNNRSSLTLVKPSFYPYTKIRCSRGGFLRVTRSNPLPPRLTWTRTSRTLSNTRVACNRAS